MRIPNSQKDMAYLSWCRTTISLREKFSMSNLLLRMCKIKRWSKVLHRQNYILNNIRGRQSVKTLLKINRSSYRIKILWIVANKKYRGHQSNSPVSSVLEREWLKFVITRMSLNRLLMPTSNWSTRVLYRQKSKPNSKRVHLVRP